MGVIASSHVPQRVPAYVKAIAAVVGLLGSVVGILASLGVVGGGHAGGIQAARVIQIPSGAPATPDTLQRYDGAQFSLSYPQGWRISSVDRGAGVSETTITSPRDPGVLIRVDVSRSSFNAQAELGLRALAATDRPGYRRLSLGVATVAGFGAARWDYLVREGGVELRKTEIVFSDERGNGYGLVEQAPAATAARWQGIFGDVRDSLVPTTA